MKATKTTGPAFLGAALLLTLGPVNADDAAPDAAVGEFRVLAAIPPAKRSAEETRRIGVLWRTTEKLRTRGAWYRVLQAGDSILTFPGMMAGKRVSYDPKARTYTIREIVHSRHPDEDTWDRAIVLSEGLIVLNKSEMKMNSR